jgi:hypothetical protein
MKNKNFSLIEEKNILSSTEKEFINNFILGDNFPFFWNKMQTEYDKDPYFSHVLLRRDSLEINSIHFDFFFNILNNFCKKNNIKIKKILRGCINLTYPLQKKIGAIHKDHDLDHKLFILYLSDPNGGNTYLYNENKKLIKEIKAKQFSSVCFNNCFHSAGLPNKDRRVILIFNFI